MLISFALLQAEGRIQKKNQSVPSIKKEEFAAAILFSVHKISFKPVC